MNCDCPRATGIVHYEECPLHDSHSCAICECEGHGGQLRDKRIRAEVLAAVIKKLESSCNCPESVLYIGCHTDECPTLAIELLQSLQPAAAALEELLREAELKGRLEEYRRVHGNSLLGGPCCTMDCRGCEHIFELERELEKARAILEEKK